MSKKPSSSAVPRSSGKPLFDFSSIKAPRTYPVHLEFFTKHTQEQDTCDHLIGCDRHGEEYTYEELGEFMDATFARYKEMIDNRLEELLQRVSIPVAWVEEVAEADRLYKQGMDDAEGAWLDADYDACITAGDGTVYHTCPHCGYDNTKGFI